VPSVQKEKREDIKQTWVTRSSPLHFINQNSRVNASALTRLPHWIQRIKKGFMLICIIFMSSISTQLNTFTFDVFRMRHQSSLSWKCPAETSFLLAYDMMDWDLKQKRFWEVYFFYFDTKFHITFLAELSRHIKFTLFLPEQQIEKLTFIQLNTL